MKTITELDFEKPFQRKIVATLLRIPTLNLTFGRSVWLIILADNLGR